MDIQAMISHPAPFKMLGMFSRPVKLTDFFPGGRAVARHSETKL
jgi:hypothetical protein